jgi:hypothetical protein
MILDITIGRTVESMEPVPFVKRVASRNRDYRALDESRHGRWHVTYVDGTESFTWGDDLLFLP